MAYQLEVLKWINFPKDATEGYEKIIGDKLREEPTLLVADSLSAVENVIRHKAVYPGVCEKIINYMNYYLINTIFLKPESLVSLLIRSHEKSNKICRVTSSPELKAYPSSTIQLGFPKGSYFAPAFSE